GVVEAFAFLHRGRTGVGDRDRLTSEAQHRRLEGEPGPGRRLEEREGEETAGERRRRALSLGDRDHPSGGAEDLVDVLPGQVSDGDDVPSPEGHCARERPARFNRWDPPWPTAGGDGRRREVRAPSARRPRGGRGGRRPTPASTASWSSPGGSTTSSCGM